MQEERVFGFPILKSDPQEWIDGILRGKRNSDFVNGTAHLPAMERLWAQYGIGDDHEPTEPYEWDALREYIEGRSNHEQAAERLLDIRIRNNDINTETHHKGLRAAWMLWDFCLMISEHQYQLLLLFNAIRALPILPMREQHRDQLSKLKVLKWFLWKNLPYWNHEFWDEQYTSKSSVSYHLQ